MLKRVLVVVFILILGGCIYSTKINSSYAVGETESSTVNETVQEKDKGTSLIAAALAVGLAAIGSGIAVAVVASSAVGAISENPSLLGKTVIFAGLAEGIAIYGLIVSIMILSKV
mgnify:CR=1 FL=1